MSLYALIQSRAPLSAIQQALANGADSNEPAVIELFHSFEAEATYLTGVFTLPQIVSAWKAQEQIYDQAASVMIDALASGLVKRARRAMDRMRDLQGPIDVELETGPILVTAVLGRWPVASVRLVVERGGIDPHRYRADLVRLLENTAEGPWKTAVQEALRMSGPQASNGNASASEAA